MALERSMFVLAAIGLVDAISYMAVAPSLIFYVLQLGGTKEQYGLIMSIFSFASFSAKPVYGAWVDKGGNKFRIPYLASLAISVIGALLYFLAVQASSSAVAVGMILVGRFLSGLGAANQALGYAYLASVVPPDMQTRTSTLLSMMRIVGMTVGPGINYFLDTVEGQVFGIPVNPLNAVGLLLAIGNFGTALTVYFLLPEPPAKDEIKLPETMEVAPSSADFWHAFLSVDILLPTFILFVANSCFQLIETALPPAASHGLGWGPVETSGVLGATSIIIFGVMMLVMFLSGRKVSDTKLVMIGNFCFMVGTVFIYTSWMEGAHVWQFVVPVMMSVAGFPFIASPNRSNFTKAVMSQPALESSQATMQAVLSMFSSVAGFTTPGFVAAYVIRSPEQVEASSDNRELTPLALYAPVLCALSLVGLHYGQWKKKKTTVDTSGHADEATPLVSKTTMIRKKSSVAGLNQAFGRSNVVARRSSVEIMGFQGGLDTLAEQEIQEGQLADLEEFQKLINMDLDDEMN